MRHILKLFQLQLSEPEQTQYLEELFKFWAKVQPEHLYEFIEKSPSTTQRSRAALWLLRSNEWKDALTNQQISRSKRLLTDEDKKEYHSSEINASN